MKGYDDGETVQWRGVTSTEFVCVSMGLMVRIYIHHFWVPSFAALLH